MQTRKQLGDYCHREVLGQSGSSGELFRRLVNRTNDGLGVESVGKRRIKDAAKLFVLSNGVNVVAIC